MLKKLSIAPLALGLCLLYSSTVEGENCNSWSKASSNQVYIAHNYESTCPMNITKYMICIPNTSQLVLKKLDLKVTLFVVPSYANTESDASLRIYMNGTIDEETINKFVKINKKMSFHPRYTLGAIVKLNKPNNRQISIKNCKTLLRITNKTDYECNMTEAPYIIQKATQDCFEKVVQKNSNETHEENQPASTWSTGVISIFVILLLAETVTCTLLWFVCLRSPRLYNAARNAQNLIRRNTVLENLPNLTPEPDIYHNMEDPFRDCSRARRHSSEQHGGHYELEKTPESEEILEKGNIKYWHPVGSVEDIYSEIQQRQYPLIKPSSVKIIHVIGEGEFGEVYKGEWTTDDNVVQVAVKELKESASEEDRAKLLKEAALMGQFDHKHIVKLFGVANNGEQVLLVMEFLSGGDLEECLLIQCQNETFQPKSQLAKQLLKFCTHIADAMAYLSDRGFIHRDLAARNILLDEHMQCKIADFGMSRELKEDYYYRRKKGRIPVKWTAPEAIFYKKYSTKSDVWSYGMVMYEIWSLGNKPFEDLALEKVLRVLDRGYCHPPPPGCPRGIYHVMVECWHPDAHKRPTFKDLLEKLQTNASTLLRWEEKDNAGPEAATLGAPLQYGATLHQDLQQMYQL